MNNILFEGIFSATFSIYDENLNVMKDSVKKLLDYNVKNGIKGFYVGGNTGECTVLPNKTRKQMLEVVKENVNENIQIMAHVGAGHFDDVSDLLDHANSVGVDAVASLPPSLTSFYKPQEIIEYYKILAEKSKSPVLAYVTPVLTCDLVWFAEELMKIENVIGIKMSIPNYFYFEQLKSVNGGNINVLNGPDESMLSGLSMGADGAVGTTYNILPKTSCEIYNAFKTGDMKTALEKQKKLNKLISILFNNEVEEWKETLAWLDIDPGYEVLPRIPTHKEAKKALDEVKKTGLFDEFIK